MTKIIDGCSEAAFRQNEILRYAVAHRLTVGGEAASRLGAEIRERHASVPCADVVGLRNILVHEYFGVHWPLVFQTAADKVPGLRAAIADIIATEFPA